LPDGTFSNPNFGKILECLAMEDVAVFRLIYRSLVYFVAIWNILRVFGIYFSVFGMFCPEKSGNPDFMPENPFNDTYLGGARVTKIVI
jgi:hypothetical protein